MTLRELLNRANEGYPDYFLARYYDPKTGRRKRGSGDTLAEFVVAELTDTFDPDAMDAEQVKEAIWALERAKWNLDDTIAVLQARSPETTSSKDAT